MDQRVEAIVRFRHGQSQRRLIDDLLDVSRITMGKLTLHKQPVELRDVLQHAVETARPLIELRTRTAST